MSYYATINFLAISVFVILLIMVSSNGKFSKKARKGLKFAFLLGIFGIVGEWIGYILQIEFVNYERIQSIVILTKIVKFCIIPLIPFFISNAVFEIRGTLGKGYEHIKNYLIIYEIIMWLAFLTYQVSDNYSIIYIFYNISFILVTMYMFINAFLFCKYYQNKNEIELVSIMVFIVISVFLQIVNSEIEFIWLVTALSDMFIYIYYYELIQSIDGLTTLLNHRSFKNYKLNMEDEKCVVIIQDINDFKKINDLCGHVCGDKILIDVSRIMKEHYQKYGRVYRTGGDEFTVIMEKNLEDAKKITEEFIKKVEEKVIIKNYIEQDYIMESIEKLLEELPEVLSISYGISRYDLANKEKHELEQVIKEADKEMYYYKKKINQNK